ncbi:BlaI/MecI/CopY family transcriptional regulator [Gimesia algae]|uniref:Methicillin resistance regulatory protein MecI n=1 Tax=Gimesia algae TaxID=2527971 RepID=A0A517V6F2_9PLAN|nr:BlaI/MecI/CopY family transcriptional regulator [Gimesia algae]QDT88586.1 Methicillin resistance regulatory protein MecI [Gimesia algae]
MTNAEGTLTAAQYQILEVIWSGPDAGATVTQIWQAICHQREVTRTTVLNQVDRLEKRGWLRRKKHDDGYRYVATQSREQAAREITAEFVDSYFAGSASELLMSLLGTKKLKPAEIARLRKLLNSNSTDRKKQ